MASTTLSRRRRNGGTAPFFNKLSRRRITMQRTETIESPSVNELAKAEAGTEELND